MKNAASLEPLSDGLVVRIGNKSPLQVTEWTSRSGGVPGVGTFIRLRDDGDAVELDRHSLCVPWSSVAQLTPEELRFMGLPDAAPFVLQVTANGAIHDPNFKLRYGYVRDGRRILGVQRQGAWLYAGGIDFVLLDPLYSIAEAIDQFRRHEDSNLELRLLRWGQIAEMLPAEVVVEDDSLRSLNIVVASSFELDPFPDKNGEPDFDPVIGRRETRKTETGDTDQVFARVLPVARQREFARRFRGLRRVKHRYAAGGSTFVVLTPEVERALGAVRRAQAGTADERREFLKNASGYLRGAVSDDESIDLDAVFSDDGLSERVRGVGIWVEKVLPWIVRPAEPWLPPEKLGFRIGEQWVLLSPRELPTVVDRIKEAASRGERTFRLNDGTEVPTEPSTIEAAEELLRRAQPIQRPDGVRERPETDESGGPGKSSQVLLVIDNLETLRFHHERTERKSGISAILIGLRSDLMPHQRECLNWLQGHWEAGNPGVLLADDMGLGKTFEALAFLSRLKAHVQAHHLPHRPMLVVAPTGLLRNWRDEHDKHLLGPGLGRIVEAHGRGLRKLRKTGGPSARRGGELTFGQPLLNEVVLKDADWVLTTYETLRDYQHSFGRVRWLAGVFDEAQKIKNPGARVTDAALAMNVDFSIMMTGTPVENRPADIWSILDRAEPGGFGTLKEFSRQYEKSDGHREESLVELHDRLTHPGKANTPALMLRRLKEDHIPRLPDKVVHRREVEMPPLQAETYQEIVLDEARGGRMLQTLQALRSVSLHPSSPEGCSIESYIRESARLLETIRILDEIVHCGEKALLFVEARAMQDFLIVALRRRYRLPEDVLVINGAVSGKVRKDRVDTFQRRAGFDVMILSPRAGGVGLTLTAANHVIHLSRWWNPAVEDQCTDRVFRIGQRRTVHVYLPLARHPRFGNYSFDLKLDQLMNRKRRMNRRVLAPVTATKADMRDLFSSTMTDARSGAPCIYMPGNQIDVDLLEPAAFEEWVLRQFQSAGYETRLTPRSGDRGADGLAFSGIGGRKHTIIVQCKHTQGDRKCDWVAVDEVLNSLSSYDSIIKGEPVPMVVTNAVGFTFQAVVQAKRRNVRLIDRHQLHLLRSFRHQDR